jgi:ABC-2 type transport system permease protein
VIGTLIGVKFRTLKGALRSEQDGKFRIPAFAALSLVFWAMLFRSSHWVVTEALKIEPVGELLIQRLLSISFLIFLGLLVFSNIVTVFSTFYLADELEFLMTKPIPKDMFFSARFVESLAQSSWVIFIFGLPIFIAAGVGIGAGPMYFLGLIGVLIPFVAIPTVIATLIGLLVTNILAANRTRDATLFLGLAAFSVIFIVIRALRPERLLNVIVPLLYGRSEVDFWSLGLLYLTPLAFFFVSAWAHRRFYYRGFSKAQEGRHGQSLVTVLRDRMLKRTYSRSRTLDERIDELSKSGRVGNPLREMVRKDQLVFVRDASQWSQILIVIAIVVIYLVNYKYFEIAADERLLGDVGLFFFNLAACGFVVVALSGRFLFPGVSLEGRSFWLIMQAPVSLDRFLVGKWLGGILPVLIVGQALIWSSNLLVFQNIVYAISASIIIFSITLGVSAMAVGLGAVYPQFYNPNAAKIASSFGAVIYMILGMFLVLFVLIATFRATLYWGSIAGGKPPGEIAWNSYLGVFLGLVAPAAAGWFSIRLGAAALRRRM